MDISEEIRQHLFFIRGERNRLLKDSDWVDIVDSNVITDDKRAIWREYRQLLRDITNNITLATSIPLPPNM